jgi:GNAT superfamily N-acetyltransferase
MHVTLDYRINPPVTSVDLNGLFSVGRSEPETSDWRPVLEHSLVYICAYHKNRLVGFVNVAWDGRDHAFLLDPRVHPDLRHRGIGTRLVSIAAEKVRAAGCEVLHVDFRPDLKPFYDACGFKPTPAGLIHLK